MITDIAIMLSTSLPDIDDTLIILDLFWPMLKTSVNKCDPRQQNQSYVLENNFSDFLMLKMLKFLSSTIVYYLSYLLKVSPMKSQYYFS